MTTYRQSYPSYKRATARTSDFRHIPPGIGKTKGPFQRVPNCNRITIQASESSPKAPNRSWRQTSAQPQTHRHPPCRCQPVTPVGIHRRVRIGGTAWDWRRERGPHGSAWSAGKLLAVLPQARGLQGAGLDEAGTPDFHRGLSGASMSATVFGGQLVQGRGLCNSGLAGWMMSKRSTNSPRSSFFSASVNISWLDLGQELRK